MKAFERRDAPHGWILTQWMHLHEGVDNLTWSHKAEDSPRQHGAVLPEGLLAAEDKYAMLLSPLALLA